MRVVVEVKAKITLEVPELHSIKTCKYVESVIRKGTSPSIPEGVSHLGGELISIREILEHSKVQSSNIESVAYLHGMSMLEVSFKSGGVYRYYKVPQNIYEEFMSSTSLGSYFAKNIRDKYTTDKLEFVAPSYLED